MKCVDDFRLKIRGNEYVPIMIGGMGVDISTSDLAIEVARLGGIGHISDAMIHTISDRRYNTKFSATKYQKYKYNVDNVDKSDILFDAEMLAEATRLHVNHSMEAKKGSGAIYINCMEKLTMNAAKETLKIRMNAALDAGIDGITLSAGLHLGSFELVQDNPRFRDAHLGIIVSSVRALKPFLKRASRVNRMPDFIIVEGPLAGGHLGFGMDWAEYDLKTIVEEVVLFLKDQDLNIPVIPAGGIFTGSDAVEYLEMGANAVQVATRFTTVRECGLPDKVKQEYLKAKESDVEVNGISPTGYPMRMLKKSPAIGAGTRPNCESFGYLLDKGGKCLYIDAYNAEVEKHPEKISVMDKTCLCTNMKLFKVWTCGHYVYRLKDTTVKLPDGSYHIVSTEHVFKDYQFSKDHEIKLPSPDSEKAIA